MMVYGIEQNEIPTVNFRLIIEGGHLLDDMEKNGVANLMADIMMEGTANKNPSGTGRRDRTAWSES
jgi:zinc protease